MKERERRKKVNNARIFNFHYSIKYISKWLIFDWLYLLHEYTHVHAHARSCIHERACDERACARVYEYNDILNK